MWPYEAELRFVVRATYEEASTWRDAARIKGLPVPVYLALAADVYSEHLRRLHARLKRGDERRKAREIREKP
jgi:hypothetical protein